MKRYLLAFFAILGCLSLHAAPVSLEEARTLVQRFVQSNFEQTRQSSELELVYSQPTFYVFNVGDTGFVILSADDSYRPVIGYSDQGIFNPDDMAPALQEYLDGINAYRSQRGEVAASQEAIDDWDMLRSQGHLVSRYGGKDGSFLVQTKWNQNYPYNYLCPVDADGPGGHAYAGCAATAAGQVMKYWDHPLQGQGSFSYTPRDHPEYGQQTANFGETTYDWAHMPVSISSGSSTVQIQAVALLLYHVGVALEMNYAPNGSGATTTKLCERMPAYFGYTDQMYNLKREDYTHEQYMEFIVDAIDMGWPMVHRGGGHAYVLDGYDDNGLVHFNWGWSGSSDAFYDIDNHNYTEGESAIYNCVPAEVYAATPNCPTDLTVTAADDYQLSTTVAWTNPSVTLTNQPLSNIDRIVVMREKEVIYTEENVTPGATMSFVDDEVPCFGAFDYTVYAVTNGQRGKKQVAENVNVGPTCSWKFVMTSTCMQGWKGSYISVRNASGTEVTRVTMTNNVATVNNVDVPIGPVKMVWVHVYDSLENSMSINIKNNENVSLFSYSGNINGLAEGVLYAGNNGCGNNNVCGTPSNLTVVQDENDVTVMVLNWTGVDDPGYGYVIIRDDMIIRLVNDGSTEFRDEHASLGGHCYQVAVLCEGGLNDETTNMVCESSGDYPSPRNLDFELTSTFKCKLKWDPPVTNNGREGYFLFRRSSQETEYKRVKTVNANAVTVTDNSSLTEGDYYYKLVAVYDDMEIFSAPAAYINDPNQYYIHFYYSPTGTEETHNVVRMYPNPTTGSLTIEAASMQYVEVFNLLGQKVYGEDVKGDQFTVNLKSFGSGVYMVKVQTLDGTFTERISVME